MKLSVLTASLVEREYYQQRISSLLKPQLTEDVEWLIERDNRELTIAAKFQKLLERAKGDYICFVDEDDIIPAYYISKILEAIKSKPDCVAINGIVTIDEKNPFPFYHSMKYDHWFSNDEGHFRSPNPTNPVKRELALKAGFDTTLTRGCDYYYAMKLLPFLKSETIIEECLYFYLAKTKSQENED